MVDETEVETRETLQTTIRLLIRSCTVADPRLLARVVRSITYHRRTGTLTSASLQPLIQAHFLASDPVASLLQSSLDQLPILPTPSSSSSSTPPTSSNQVSDDTPSSTESASTTDDSSSSSPTPDSSSSSSSSSTPTPKPLTPEVAYSPVIQIFLILLTTIAAIDARQIDQAIPIATALYDLIGQAGNRRISALVSKALFYYGRVFELANRSEDIRESLLKAHRTAVLRHDDETQATLINLLLRHYLQSKQYDQADHLLQHTGVNEATVSPNQCARFLYYKARVLAIQLNYKEADQLLASSLSKAPHVGALGFRITVQKLLCVVQLLLGQIPEKRIFRIPSFSLPLAAYRRLTQAVNVGDLEAFQRVVVAHQQTFVQDDTAGLISRLRASVIKAGLRKIGLAYTRIALADVQSKLRLDSLESVEFVVAKAIRDGVIDGRINAAEGYLETNAHSDVYSTHQPMEVFHTKIQSCLELHNSAVKGMRFPPEILKASERTRYGSDEEEIDPETLLDEDLEDDL